jgi:hypothetical protein
MRRHLLSVLALLFMSLSWSSWAATQPLSLTNNNNSPAKSSEIFQLGPPNGGRPVVVYANFVLNDINDIDDEADSLQFSGVLTLEWVDPREAFDPAVAGVDEKIYQGEYQFNEIATGWYPQIFLVNESGYYETSAVILRIKPDGSSTLTQTINATAEVRLNMRKFPFDKQRLNLIFQVLGYDNNEILLRLESDNNNPIDTLFPVPQWTLTNISQNVSDLPAIYTGAKGFSSVLIVSVDIKRKPFYIIRLVVIPLIVIVLLSFSVFWMDRSSLGDRLNVSFIGILTGVAYLLVTSDHLPNISYFTLIHGFLNFSYITMCATVVVNLVVGSLDKRGDSKPGDRVDSICRWAFPLVYFVVLIIMFAVAGLLY